MNVNELKEGQSVVIDLMCVGAQRLMAKGDKPYLDLKLSDKTGKVDGKFWGVSDSIKTPPTGVVLRIGASVTKFSGNLQLNINSIQDLGKDNLIDFCPSTDKDVDVMLTEFVNIVQSIEESSLRYIVNTIIFKGQGIKEKIRRHSAAKTVHHAFIGGWLEHTLSITKSAISMAEKDPSLDRDLLVSASILHDIGKLYELSSFPENEYTEDGYLLGHIFIGADLVSNVAYGVGLREEIKVKELIHCILSHHGELEYGSPKKPAIVEAVVIAYLDNLDAKVQTMKEITKSLGDGEWSPWNRYAETNVRKTSGSGKNGGQIG